MHVQVTGTGTNVNGLLTYLFTWCKVSNGPGRASQESSFSGICSAPVVFARTINLRPANHLVAQSQLLILLLEVRTLGHCSNSVWDFIPVVHHSHTKEISPDLHAALPHSPVVMGLPCCESLSPHLCTAMTNHCDGSRPSLLLVILWTMAVSAWCRCYSRVGVPSSTSLSLYSLLISSDAIRIPSPI